MAEILTVTMPDIGEGVVEGEVVQWLKKVGDSLGQDEPVVILMTDKATVELPSPQPGKLAKQYFQQGELAIKGKPLYDIALQSSSPQVKTVPKESSPPPLQPPKTSPPRISLPPHQGKTLATPATRQLAKELGVDLHTLTGSGKEGRILPSDLHSVQPKPTVNAMEGDEVRPLQGIRRLTAAQVALAKSSIPHFTYCDTAEMPSLIKLREKLQPEASKQGFHLTYTPFFIRALSLTLKQFPDFNAAFDANANALVVRRPHNIGIAMKTALGLIVPVLKEVQEMSFEQVVHSYYALRDRALTNKLNSSEMQEGTITLSNFGTEGGRWATPVIRVPEIAILATARIRQEPCVKSGQIVIRDTLNCSWSFDHRVIDGDMAAAFSNAFIQLLENPTRLL